MTSPTSPRASHRRPAPPLAGLRASIVGCGRVGESLGHWLLGQGAEILFLSGRRRPPQSLVEHFRASFRPVNELTTGGQGLLLIATPDDTLEEIAQNLSRRPQAKVGLHVSGALGAETLAPLRAAGCAIGTLHPLRAFTHPSRNFEEARSTFFALDGDPAAVDLSRRLANAWHGEAAMVPPEARILYHFAATLAAGGVVTLLAIATEIARRYDLPMAAVEGYLALARGALAQAAATEDPASALTGPAARGDAKALQRQRRQLETEMPHLLPLFTSLTRETQRLFEACHRTPSSATIPALDSGIGERPPEAS